MLYPAQVVDGLTHLHAGPELRDALAALPADATGQRCPVGAAVLSAPFGLHERFDAIAHIPITKSTLNTALPMIVPKPTADPVNAPMKDVASSGIEPPAAMKVAPATSGEMPFTSMSSFNAVTKYSSQTMAMPRQMYRKPMP